MILLVCGSREWCDTEAIEYHLKRLSPSVVIHGACRGADVIAGQIAKRMGISVKTYPANWGKHGKAAGYIRNQEMLDKGHPDRLIAFWDGQSRGTKDMQARARYAGIPVEVVTMRLPFMAQTYEEVMSSQQSA
jgi:hypothetical protein